MQKNTITLAILAALLLAGKPMSAHAQRMDDEADDKTQESMSRAASMLHRGHQKAQQEQQAQAEAPRYPNATRQEPGLKASPALQPELQKIFKAYGDKDIATATSLADAVIANPAGNAYDHAIAARLAGVALLNTDNARARDYLQKSLDFNGLSNNEHYESMHLVAQIDMGDQKYDQALADFDKFMSETKTQDPEDLASKGNALYRLGRYPESIDVLKQAVAADPGKQHADWLQLLMAGYSKANQPQEAAKIAATLSGSAAGGDDKQTQLNLAASYMQAGQNDQAITVLEKLRAAGQLTDAADFQNLYALHFNAKQDAAGIAVIEDGLQKGILPSDAKTLEALAQGYWFSGQVDKAVEAYRKAAPLASNGDTYLNLARALYNEGRTAEAKQAAQQALDKGLANPADAKKIIGAGK